MTANAVPPRPVSSDNRLIIERGGYRPSTSGPAAPPGKMQDGYRPTTSGPLKPPATMAERDAALADAARLREALKHAVHWHDQLTKQDIAMMKAALAGEPGR